MTAKMIELDKPPIRETAALVRLALPTDSETEVEESIEEMRLLADTAGADVVFVSIQRREAPNPGTLLGSGKIEEIRAACDETGANIVLVDSNLTPRQGSKLEKLLDRKVVDRTQLILDIFAQHAHTNEGKIQVELAQLDYILPRLAGRGSIMRQQGGIGVRGPGEQKLEVDRRVIRRRMSLLKEQLKGIRKKRIVQRKRRVESTVGTVALVGYTNAGKSSLLNALAGSDVLVEDKLFATLDPRSRRCTLPSEREVILTDTVGFIRKLPHTLVDAFRATLEEVNDADVLLLVADAAHPAVEDHIRAVYEVLEEIKVSGKTVVTVYNKADIAETARMDQLVRTTPEAIGVSAHTGEGLAPLLERVDALLATNHSRVRLRIPQSHAKLVAQVHESGRVLSQEYQGEDVILEAEIGRALENKLAEYVSQ